MSAIDQLLPDIIQHVAGCPDVTAMAATVDALEELCRNANVWVRETDVESVTAGSDIYDLPLSSSEAITEVIDVYVDGGQIFPLSIPELGRTYQNWKTASGAPRHYFVDGSAIRLVPIPTADVTIQAGIAVKPTRTATQIDDRVYSSYWHTLIHGALYRLMALPKQPWTNPEMALFHRNEWRIGMDNARINVMKSNTTATTRVTPHPL